jgi:hypothetical protein
MPTAGRFVLHSQVEPPLPAGDYVLHGEQQVAGGPVAPYDGHLRLASPRYAMPADQILSTFPPANAQGAFSSRLPQVVLRRRTLPWERPAGPGAAAVTPWLALVVVAEGEGQLSGETPVGQCVTPGVTLTGPNDVATGVYLAVTRTVVNAVFPTSQDLPLLAHVREVDIDDTELALGDDDGWLAVVLANRLPQPGKRYLACLLNLEGQLGVLPAPTLPAARFDGTLVVQDFRALAPDLDPDRYLMNRAAGTATAGLATPGAAAPAGTTGRRAPAVGGWETAPQTVERLAVSAAAEDAYRVVRDGMTIGFRVPIEAVAAEPTYRFPVLAHWSFTCSEAGDFESLMRHLDVGLLGTLPRPPVRPPGAPPAPAPPRPAPEVVETGHVGLAHLTRRGEATMAWFRGPLAPQLVERQQPGADGRLPVAHASDQVRRIVPDGREDLTYAAAFEIGRLLALAQPSVVAALLRWRQEQFGAERARKLAETIAAGLPVLGDVLAGRPPIAVIGPLVAGRILLAAAADPVAVLGPSRPPADPGRPLAFVGVDVDGVVAKGLGLDLDALREAAGRVGIAGALGATAVPIAPVDPGEPLMAGPDADHLRRTLAETAARIAADAVPPTPTPVGDAGVAPRPRPAADDPLDRLLRSIPGYQEEQP